MRIHPVSIGATHHKVYEPSAVPRVLDTDHLHTRQVHLVARWAHTVKRVAVERRLGDPKFLDFTHLDRVSRVDNGRSSVRRCERENAQALYRSHLMDHSTNSHAVIHLELVLETG